MKEKYALQKRLIYKCTLMKLLNEKTLRKKAHFEIFAVLAHKENKKKMRQKCTKQEIKAFSLSFDAQEARLEPRGILILSGW